VVELLGDPELVAVAGSGWPPLRGDLALAEAMQGAVFFALLCCLRFAATGGAFGAVERPEAELFVAAGGLACGALGLWGAGVDESAGLT
jgi:hypothetical protein